MAGLRGCFFLAAAVGVLLISLALASSATDFDFFYHVQQWPGSYCNTKNGCCIPDGGNPPADFTLHGLWPQYAACRPSLGDDDLLVVQNDGEELERKKCWPEFCSTEKLRLAQISDLLGDMQLTWPTLSCTNKENLPFWSHEWEKHGTCSNLGQHTYFQLALQHQARYNLTAILAGAGIVPSGEATYYLSSIRDAIAEATGSAPNFACNRDESGETQQLLEVYQCLDLTGTRPVNCTLPKSGCTDKVKFPEV
ncbi:hypothetical protein GUJ93_ZPchr0007g6261 [Zizania palustris]|uniref:Uncharacterized protein n=1 Tax=Zizania palustris TaxID=103762 RepID=A0A8J5T523_ZIZPA|nr:hypothetical protein GUJ93_ZPchr0007g6261 [Zizania palustris]